MLCALYPVSLNDKEHLAKLPYNITTRMSTLIRATRRRISLVPPACVRSAQRRFITCVGSYMHLNSRGTEQAQSHWIPLVAPLYASASLPPLTLGNYEPVISTILPFQKHCLSRIIRHVTFQDWLLFTWCNSLAGHSSCCINK